MKKKMYVIAAILVVLAILGTGTLAYFTTRVVTHNVITSGDIDIQLVETAIKNGQEVDYVNNSTGLMPGQDHSKIVKVRNTGSNPAWVRLKVQISITDETGKALSDAVLDIDYDTGINGAWEEKDGAFYYKQKLDPGNLTKPLFRTVSFLKSAGDEYQNAKIGIAVQAEGIQYENNTNYATAWPTGVAILPNLK